MSDPASLRPARPQSVKEIVDQADNFTFASTVPMKFWTRAADTLYQEAMFALAEGDYGKAYMFLMRHSILVIQHLPKHPAIKDPENTKSFRALKERLPAVLVDLEQIKPEIERAYKEWERMQPSGKERKQRQGPARSYSEFASRDPTLSGNVKILDASENQELAVDLAQQDLKRRDSAKRASRRAGLSDEEALARRRAGRWDHWDSTSTPTHDVDLQKQMEAARQTLDTNREGGRPRGYEASAASTAHNYSYPSVSKPHQVDMARADDRRPPSSGTSARTRDSMPPPRPEKMPEQRQPPSVPRKTPLEEYQPLRPSNAELPALPSKEPLRIPQPPQSERLTFKPGAYQENGDPIRSLFMPRDLRQKFLEIASPNTRAGLEMCGILCGRPINNALFISCLLIPDQTCTSDTCETENESSMFDYMDKEDLLTLGWIHTHPTQTCFMSSRDLHTHAGYQMMMKESVAIVCAPSFQPSYGIFRLTNPPGLDHIIGCNLPGIFHPHSVDNLYTSAERPVGHVYESSKLPLEVVDLRSKSR